MESILAIILLVCCPVGILASVSRILARREYEEEVANRLARYAGPNR